MFVFIFLCFFACIVLIFANVHGQMNFPWTIVERAFSPPLLPVIARMPGYRESEPSDPEPYDHFMNLIRFHEKRL